MYVWEQISLTSVFSVYSLWSANVNCIWTLIIGRHHGWNAAKCVCLCVWWKVYGSGRSISCLLLLYGRRVLFGSIDFRYSFFVSTFFHFKWTLNDALVNEKAADFLTPTHRFTWQTMPTRTHRCVCACVMLWSIKHKYTFRFMCCTIFWQFGGYLALSTPIGRGWRWRLPALH